MRSSASSEAKDILVKKVCIPLLSVTITLRETLALFPLESLTEYVTTYVPPIDVSTVELVCIRAEISPSLSSIAVAPGSLKESLILRFIGSLPKSVITGAMVSGIGSEITTLLSIETLLPSESITV